MTPFKEMEFIHRILNIGYNYILDFIIYIFELTLT